MRQRADATNFSWGVGVALTAALAAPFLLWPVEQLLPWPVWIEEGYKLWLVWLVLRSRASHGVFWVFLVGLGFGISETMLYLLNVMQTGDLASWGLRLVTTVPMHVVTMLIQYGGWVMGLGPLGVIPAGLLHQWFNSVI